MNARQIILSVIIAVTIFATVVGLGGIVKIKPVPALSDTSAITGKTTTTGSLSSEGQKFRAKMTGDKEVPPVNTDTTGTIRLAVATTNSQKENALDYDLTLTNLNGAITGADIHIGKQGVNGPIAADLNTASSGGAAAAASSSSSGGGSSTMTSNSISGTITSADLKGPLEDKQISDLVKLIEEGRTYVNVNTEQYPDGEIRGQLSSSSSASSSAHTTSTDNTISASALASTSISESPSASASATATP